MSAVSASLRLGQVAVIVLLPLAAAASGGAFPAASKTPAPQPRPAETLPAGGRPTPPPPVPPQYDELKDLHLEIPLVEGGRPSAAIVAPASGIYHAAAAAIQRAIETRANVRLPIVADDSAEAAVPLAGHRIVLGNRSTSRTISALYDLYYCLVDLKYPGVEGYVLRSVHNPFGNGKSVVIVGGSDAAGVSDGAAALAEILSKAPVAEGEMSIGWTMVTRLGKGVTPPAAIEDFEVWEASKGYGSSGYFGWTSISKRMAMYYMTGDALSAREVIRLALPDKRAIREIEEIDGERIENKHDPLAGLYHYNAHIAILFWDLIEESPLFTDEERLKVTNAFARQLNHRKGEGIYRLTRAPAGGGSRHGQWAAISLYCLGRYFNKDYPHPVWEHSIRSAQLAFEPLHRHAWIAGENDNLYWYNTGIAPVLTYMVLSGDRKPLESGVLGELLRGLEVLVSGRVPDWALNYAALDFLNKAAYLTSDGRWISYRERTGVDTGVFRLGQSFWPDEALQPKPPEDLAGKWSISRLSKPAWDARRSGIPFDESFYVGSYRSAADESGDYILLDGFNGASRNPYHAFDILELRIGGRTILQGYHNQVLSSADGMVEPAVAMDAALRYSGVVGQTAVAVGEVPKAAFCNWRRTLCQRTGQYALIVDDLRFRTRSRNMKVTTTWQSAGGRWDENQQALRAPADFQLRSCDVQEAGGRGLVAMTWNGAVAKDARRTVFYLIGQAASNAPAKLACTRLAEGAAALALPQPALAVAGAYAEVNGQLAVLATDHLYGRAITSAGAGGVLFASDAPVDLDWDFKTGIANLAAAEPATLRLCLAAADALRIDGRPAGADRAGGLCRVRLPQGRHTLTGASPPGEAAAHLAAALGGLLAQGRRLRAEALATAGEASRPTAAELPAAIAVRVGGSVTDMITMASPQGPQLCVAEGTAIHVLTSTGHELRKLATGGQVRTLRWWDEARLLLAGCADEKVIAFDGDGRRKWVFTSEMDGAVYEAAKTYWFKSAPGHEGIHGLHTGAFDEGKSRCFVGSACTLEILDEGGNLVKRIPVFWGPGRKFLLVPAPNGSQNLLISRWPNGTDELAIVNSKAMAVTGRGYYGVPAGHTYVGGWTAQNRTALFHEDLDGDGTKELATAINGTWNRVTVYSERGKPLDNAQFGPGRSNAPRAQMRGMDIADLDGDGKKELILGISEGLVVALDGKCRPIWSTRLPDPPVSLRSITPAGAKTPWVVAGCEDGAVAALDAKGALIRLGRVSGRPTHIEAMQTSAGPLAVLATDQGEVKAFRIGN